MSRILTTASVAIFALFGFFAARIARSQSSPKANPEQTQSEKTVVTPYVPTLTYDVASVRESHIDGWPGVGFTSSVDARLDRSSIRLTNWTIENLLWLAYDVRSQQIFGLPRWPIPTLFTIQAKGDEAADAKLASLTPEQRRLEQEHMMQVLLADRFKLKVHWDQGPGYSYTLVVSKPGRLQESTGAPLSEAEIKVFGNHPPPQLYQRNDGLGYDWVAHGATMKDLAPVLTVQMGAPVTDQTGLPGKYDFVLKYHGATDHDRAPDDLDPTPPLDQAIQEQLGLKLERRKDSIPRLVIDHVEKPTDN